MYRFKRLLVTVIGLAIVQTLQAQHHNNMWFRSTLSIPAGEKFKIDVEFQHRRQSGFDNGNMFNKNLMFTYRNWVHYQHSKDLRFSVSPFAYFLHYKVIQKQTDEAESPNNEVRFSAAAEWQHEILRKFYIVDRSAIEYRIFSNHQTDITRLRNRFGFRYDFAEKLKLGIFDEMLFNLSGTSHHHFFDHHRLGLNVEYKVIPKMKMDMGYMYISRLPLTSTAKIYESNFFLNLTYQLKKHKRNG